MFITHPVIVIPLKIISPEHSRVVKPGKESEAKVGADQPEGIVTDTAPL